MSKITFSLNFRMQGAAAAKPVTSFQLRRASTSLTL